MNEQHCIPLRIHCAARIWVAWAGVLTCPCLLLLICGCVKDFGTGGTGELVIPRQQLHEVAGTNLNAAAMPPPTTQEATTLPTTRPATPAAKEVHVTIEDVRRYALENNLDLKVEVLNPVIAKESLSEAQAQFEALFFANVSYTKEDAPTASKLESSQSESINVVPGIRIPLRTGGSVSFSVPINRFENNNEFSTLNPAYGANYVAQITQPLLRGAGFGVTAQPIRVAFYNYQLSEAATKLMVTRVLADADRFYWRLYAARGQLEVRKAEYDLAVAQLERARRQVRAGTAADPEVVRAESGVADSLENIINAENTVRNAQRDIKRIINHPGLEMDADTIVIPQTRPGVLFYRLNREQVVGVALRQRMEMLETELQIAQDTNNIRVARNALLPLVTLDYTYNIPGLGGSLNDAFGMAGDHDFDTHTVGLNIEVPIGNEAAKAALRRALVTRIQALATRRLRTAQITQEVLNALDALEANWLHIMASRKRVVYAQRVLDVETRQFGLGLRTSTDVLDAQTKLASAQVSEISAIADYQISQVDIAFATGTVLGASKVVWEPTTIKK